MVTLSSLTLRVRIGRIVRPTVSVSERRTDVPTTRIPTLRHMLRLLILFVVLVSVQRDGRGEAPVFADDIRPMLDKYCLRCHSGKDAKGQVDFSTITSQVAADGEYELWERVVERLRDGEMPPDDEPQPSAGQVERFQAWYQSRFVDEVQARPGVFRPRRLSAHEFRNTLRSILGFDLEVNIIEAEQTLVEKSLVMKLLPLDPPGKSGFRNDTSGNPLTTVIWDQYSYLVDVGLTSLFEPQYREHLEFYTGLIADSGLTYSQAEQLVRRLVKRAYRRTVPEPEISRILSALDRESDGAALTAALKIELKAVLMSPQFIYRGLGMEGLGMEGLGMEGKPDHAGQQAVDQFELAERLSYFVWADMPDDALMAKAESRLLDDPAVFRGEVVRLLDSPKARNLAEDFVVQWLAIDEIDHVSNNPPHAVALKSQPIDFANYLFAEDRPLMELVDSKVTFVSPLIAGFYPKDRQRMTPYRKPKGIEIEIVPNQKLSLEKTTDRGGIITMPGVLAMNKGPVLRGVWVLERILGEHLPDPPADVGQVAQNRRGEKLSFRERFELHRSKPTCALCHDKIDPLGFSLQRYDAKGSFIRKAKQEVDTTGRLSNGVEFEDYAELKQILATSQRRKIIRNIVERTMSYALCRKLHVYDRPTIDNITAELDETNGTYRDMVFLITESLPFRETIISNWRANGSASAE